MYHYFIKVFPILEQSGYQFRKARELDLTTMRRDVCVSGVLTKVTPR